MKPMRVVVSLALTFPSLKNHNSFASFIDYCAAQNAHRIHIALLFGLLTKVWISRVILKSRPVTLLLILFVVRGIYIRHGGHFCEPSRRPVRL